MLPLERWQPSPLMPLKPGTSEPQGLSRMLPWDFSVTTIQSDNQLLVTYCLRHSSTTHPHTLTGLVLLQKYQWCFIETDVKNDNVSTLT